MVASIAAVCTPSAANAIGKEVPTVKACVGEAARQSGITAGTNISPAPCAFAIRNDHRNKPPSPTCMPNRTL